MGKRDELNEQALLAASLRRQKMTISQIALYLGVPERKVFRLLIRAGNLYKLLAAASDSERNIGETLTVFEEMEREALQKFAKAPPNSTIAVAYLNAARDARKEIKKLLQEAGLMKRVPDQVNVGFVTKEDLKDDEIRADSLALVKKVRERQEKSPET